MIPIKQLDSLIPKQFQSHLECLL